MKNSTSENPSNLSGLLLQAGFKRLTLCRRISRLDKLKTSFDTNSKAESLEVSLSCDRIRQTCIRVRPEIRRSLKVQVEHEKSLSQCPPVQLPLARGSECQVTVEYRTERSEGGYAAKALDTQVLSRHSPSRWALGKERSERIPIRTIQKKWKPIGFLGAKAIHSIELESDRDVWILSPKGL